MSYSRFGAHSSDVYVYRSVGNDELPLGWLECCGCRLSEIDGGTYFFKALTTADMIAHLAQHRQAGHTVPDRCIATLLADQVDNDAALSSSNAAPKPDAQ